MTRVRRDAAVWAVALTAATLMSCQRSAPRPSIVLAVLDTTRADAVSAYGTAVQTTPTIDALARSGLLYEHAYANANWTLPSHASLFTGLLVSQHGVRDGNDKLESMPTLAGELKRAGYETMGVNENPWLSPTKGLTQGFDNFVAAGTMSATVQKWLAGRTDDRPFFLFLNIMDAHWPYRVRDANPFLPAGVTVEQARSVAKDLEQYRCNIKPGDAALGILHGLYLGNVQAADAKLGSVLASLTAVKGPVIVIVASDHGEHFAEHGLVEHDVGVDRAVTQVPLVVHGVPGVAAAIIDTPVQLVDVMPTVLGWAGVKAPAGLAGQPLPMAAPAQARERAIVAEFHDYRDERFYGQFPDSIQEQLKRRWMHCTESDRVTGDMRSIIRFPYELIWYERYPPQLFDLSTDPTEQQDLALLMPERVAELAAHLQQVLTAAGRRAAPTAELDAAQVERLRALGYLGAGATEHTDAGEAPP